MKAAFTTSLHGEYNMELIWPANERGYQEPLCSGTRVITGRIPRTNAAIIANSKAWIRPGSWELARIAVSIVTVTIVPICIHIVRSAARVEECSGASCSPALRLAGLFAPRPTPMRNAEPDSHKSEERIGRLARISDPSRVWRRA